MSPVCVEIYIFRGSVSFLMSKSYWTHIKTPVTTPTAGFIAVTSNQPLSCNWQSKFETTNQCQGLDKNDQNHFLKRKHVLVQISVQIPDSPIQFSFFCFWVFSPPPPSECLAHGNLKENKTMWFCSIVVCVYLGLGEFLSEYLASHS